MNRRLKRAAQCADAEGKNWREQLRKFLLTYRTTPHNITGVRPASLMFKHQMRNDIHYFDITCETKLDLQVSKQDAKITKVNLIKSSRFTQAAVRFKVPQEPISFPTPHI